MSGVVHCDGVTGTVFCDGEAGDDANPGTKERPVRTKKRAFELLPRAWSGPGPKIDFKHGWEAFGEGDEAKKAYVEFRSRTERK